MAPITRRDVLVEQSSPFMFGSINICTQFCFPYGVLDRPYERIGPLITRMISPLSTSLAVEMPKRIDTIGVAQKQRFRDEITGIH